MKELIKAIRAAANMSQEQFAATLGTTPLSINRWENGKTLPNRMAQTQLYNFCLENKISVYQLIIDKIKTEAEKIDIEEEKVFLDRIKCDDELDRTDYFYLPGKILQVPRKSFRNR